MEQRAAFLIRYAEQHGPVTVRQLYYRAEVEGVPGISKDERDYRKIQRQVLLLRRAERIPYSDIADASRWMRKPRTYTSIEEALEVTAATYRRSLWATTDERVEIWVEKDALAGVIYPITSLYDVPLMVTRGFSSETFCFEAVEAYRDNAVTYVYYLGDFDRAGVDACNSLQEKLERFAGERSVAVVFMPLAVTLDQVQDMNLSTREPKRVTPADRKWPHAFACELDAIEPDALREMVEHAIRYHVSDRELEVLRAAEQSERQILRQWVRARQSGG